MLFNEYKHIPLIDQATQLLKPLKVTAINILKQSMKDKNQK